MAGGSQARTLVTLRAKVPPSGLEVKWNALELCNFYFRCAAIFCQPMKKCEVFGVFRSTRQRHFKTTSTGDENDGNASQSVTLVRAPRDPEKVKFETETTTSSS